MLDRPRLRSVEAFPVQQNGKILIYLKDPLNFAPAIGISPAGYFIASHFDGQHTFLDIQEAYCRQFGTLLISDDLKKFVEMLDQHYYLLSARFLTYQESVIEDFKRRPTRAATHAGTVYKTSPDALKNQLKEYFISPEGPGLPSYESDTPPPNAIVAPHIDFHRGGPAYAWAYKALAESSGADLYIVLGTSHCGGNNTFVLTLKDFDTPLGTVETDKRFVNSLQEKSEQDLFADEYLHRGEHSIEFQVLFLKYIAQWRAEMNVRSEKPFKIVPVLVSSFQPMVQSGVYPERHPPVATFLKALQDLLSGETRKICVVAGVDLAHVGRQFGDREEITADFLKWVGDEDQLLIDRLAALDAPGFFNEIAKDQDRRRICGFSPLYSLIQLRRGGRGKNLRYSQAFTRETASAVTFTSMIFE
jgi:AmmeMemoRadiSam system protein B